MYAIRSYYVILGIGGYAWCSNNIASQADSSVVSLSGQLTDYIDLETAIQSAVDQNDFTTAVAKANDLEHDWDVSASQLRKIDSSTWSDIVV